MCIPGKYYWCPACKTWPSIIKQVYSASPVVEYRQWDNDDKYELLASNVDDIDCVVRCGACDAEAEFKEEERKE
jgi:hypothetical protein